MNERKENVACMYHKSQEYLCCFTMNIDFPLQTPSLPPQPHPSIMKTTSKIQRYFSAEKAKLRMPAIQKHDMILPTSLPSSFPLLPPPNPRNPGGNFV